jgi:hypothetical protein
MVSVNVYVLCHASVFGITRLANTRILYGRASHSFTSIRFIDELFTQFESFDDLLELCIALNLLEVLSDPLSI